MDPLHSKCFTLERHYFLCSLALLSLSLCSSPFEISDICFSVFLPFQPLDVTELALFLQLYIEVFAPLLCLARRMCMRVTEEILHIIEIEDGYIRNDGRQIYTYIYIYIYIHIYIYKRKISIDITCVGLASARPNNQWQQYLTKITST